MNFAAAGERRRVAEEIAGERDAGGDRVVQRLLHDVGVLRVAGDVEQPVVPEHHRRRGAGLLIGVLVRQVVVRREALVVLRRADPAGDVHPVQRHAVVQRLRGAPQPGSLVSCDHVGHRAIQEHRAHGVADRFLLLAHRHVVLRVAGVEVLRILQVEALVPLADAERLAEEVDRAVGVELLELALEDRWLLAAPVEHRLRQLEVALLAGGARQLHERQLDAFVAGDVVLLTRPELAVEDVGHPRRDREQRLLAR